MSLNKIYILCLLLAVVFVSCGKKNPDPDQNSNGNNSVFANPDSLMAAAKRILGKDVKYATLGKFGADTADQVVAGVEIANRQEYGIKFYQFAIKGNQLQEVYHTDLLNGSFDKSLVQKINFSSFNYDLIYYNSLNYFIGTREGEVFSYVLDIKNHNVCYAHMFFTDGKRESMYLSPNINSQEVKDFFVNNFKKDFPDLKIVTKDRNLDQ